MPVRTKSELDGLQQEYLTGNFSLDIEPLNQFKARIAQENSFKVSEAPTAAFFIRTEMVEYISSLNTDFVKVFLVRTGGNQLTMAIAGANDDFVVSGVDRPTDTIFAPNGQSSEEQGLLAFRPCPPYCQDDGERSKHANKFFVVRLLD